MLTSSRNLNNAMKKKINKQCNQIYQQNEEYHIKQNIWKYILILFKKEKGSEKKKKRKKAQRS